MQHIITRFKIDSSTDVNAKNFIKLMKSDGTQQVILFALPTKRDETAGRNEQTCHEDPGDNNLPAMVALVEFEIHNTAQVSIVVDGTFLTAVRTIRYEEVKWVLDEAVKSEKAMWGRERAPFTAQKSPEEAYKALMAIPFSSLTMKSRPEYFSLLSCLPEEGILNL